MADLVAFVRDRPDERFSQSYTRDLNGRLRISTGDVLYTTAGEAIPEITEDDCGVHDVLFGPCTEWMLTDPTLRESRTRTNAESVVRCPLPERSR